MSRFANPTNEEKQTIAQKLYGDERGNASEQDIAKVQSFYAQLPEVRESYRRWNDKEESDESKSTSGNSAMLSTIDNLKLLKIAQQVSRSSEEKIQFVKGVGMAVDAGVIDIDRICTKKVGSTKTAVGKKLDSMHKEIEQVFFTSISDKMKTEMGKTKK